MKVGPAPTRWPLLLVLAALLAGGSVALRTPASRQQELRVLLCARNMAMGGDWLVPAFQEQARLRKPPLAYWMAAAPMKLAGVFDSAPAGRLPFVAASCGLLVLMGAWGRRLAGTWGGVLGMVLPLATLGWWRYMALAETDAPLVLFSSLAAALLWRSGEGASRRLHFAGAGLATGLGFLAKGPAAFLPWIAYALFLATGPRSSRRGVALPALGGLLAALFTGLSWHASLWLFRGLSPFAAAQISADLPATFTGQTSHAGAWYYYLYTLPKILLPAGLLLPWVLWVAWRGRRGDPAVRFLLAWVAAGGLLLSAIPSKQDHYALQLLPPCLLLTAHTLAVRAGIWARRLAFAIPATAAGLALAFLAGLPLHRYQGLPGFFRACRPYTDAAPLVHVCGVNSALFDFHLGRHVHNVEEPMAAWRRARPGEVVVLAAPASRFQTWPAIPSAPLQEMRSNGMQAALYRKP